MEPANPSNPPSAHLLVHLSLGNVLVMILMMLILSLTMILLLKLVLLVMLKLLRNF
jgi:hypothetical protein